MTFRLACTLEQCKDQRVIQQSRRHTFHLLCRGGIAEWIEQRPSSMYKYRAIGYTVQQSIQSTHLPPCMQIAHCTHLVIRYSREGDTPTPFHIPYAWLSRYAQTLHPKTFSSTVNMYICTYLFFVVNYWDLCNSIYCRVCCVLCNYFLRVIFCHFGSLEAIF